VEASALQAPVGLGRITLSTPLLRLRSDEQLVALFRAGNDEAFRVIHDRYRQRLFAYTRQMLAGSRQDAEDALQDVFMRAYGALRADDRPVALRAWLYRVARNRCIDQLRRPVPAPAEVFEATRPPLPDPLAEAERREDLRRLIADVRRLPQQQRSVLLMRELEGLSYAELADSHEATVPAIKSLLVRARIGLVQSAEARDAGCKEVRDHLSLAHGRGVRANGLARRHLRDCAGCREYRAELRQVQRSFGALMPVSGGLLAKLTGLGGGGAAGGGAAAGGTGLVSGGAATLTVGKVCAVVCSVAVTAGGAVQVEKQIERHVLPASISPRSEPAPAGLLPPALAAAQATAAAPVPPAKVESQAKGVQEVSAPAAEGLPAMEQAEPAPTAAPSTGGATQETDPAATGGALAPDDPPAAQQPSGDPSLKGTARDAVENTSATATPPAGGSSGSRPASGSG
jgi:RNA polymerase sigma factor (sigma-70 family)